MVKKHLVEHYAWRQRRIDGGREWWAAWVYDYDAKPASRLIGLREILDAMSIVLDQHCANFKRILEHEVIWHDEDHIVTLVIWERSRHAGEPISSKETVSAP